MTSTEYGTAKTREAILASANDNGEMSQAIDDPPRITRRRRMDERYAQSSFAVGSHAPPITWGKSPNSLVAVTWCLDGILANASACVIPCNDVRRT